ncbi:MAG: hypothetical protein JHC87_05255 [Thermoleophilaceae bacterium]|nr:hypothetical protein [Thermoleophilaceae bacterium]
MTLCFIEPADAVRVVADSVGREGRRQLVGELVNAWVDSLPEDELAAHYQAAVDALDEQDLTVLAAWHASLEVGYPVANKDFLIGAFSGLQCDERREALRIAAGFRSEEALDNGASDEQVLDTVLPWLPSEQVATLASEAIRIYIWDRIGSEN